MSYDAPALPGADRATCSGSSSLPIIGAGDVILIVGTYVLPEVFPELGDIFAPGAKVIHIDLNAYEIAKNHPVDLGRGRDPKLTLAALADALERVDDARQRAAAAARADDARAARPRSAKAQRDEDAADDIGRDAVPLHASRFMEELARHAARRRDHLRRGADLLAGADPLPAADAAGRYFQTRGGSLGVGIPGRDRRQAGQSRQDRDRLHRRRRRDVHDPGALDRGAARRRRQVRDLQQRVVPAAAAQHRRSTGRSRASRSTTTR